MKIVAKKIIYFAYYYIITIKKVNIINNNISKTN
jgi:hypothetical protein